MEEVRLSEIARKKAEDDGDFSHLKPSTCTFRETKTTGIGEAIKLMRQGLAMEREGWNGKGMFVYYVPGGKYPAQTDIAKCISDDKGFVKYNPYFAIKNVDGSVSTWVPSVNDSLAEDWKVHCIY